MGSPPVVVMGVSGSGKSTVAAALARRLGVPFADADDLHPPESIAKMTAGVPLDEDDRRPWLERVGRWLARHPDGAVVACSALRRGYREQLRSQAPGVVFVHLDGSHEVIARRQSGRPGHFMPAALMASQFATLEPLAADEPGIVVDVDRPVDALVESCAAALRSWPGAPGP